MLRIQIIIRLTAAIFLGICVMTNGQENPSDEDPADARLRKFFRDLEARSIELDKEEEEAKPIRVRGGVDAEIVEYLFELEEKKNFSPIFETDEAGRVVGLGVGVSPSDGMALRPILKQIEPLRSVKSAEIYELGRDPIEAPFVDSDLMNLSEWKELTELKVAVQKVSGNAMAELTGKNQLLNLEKLSYGYGTTQADLVLASVRQCAKLRKIELTSNDLTDEGLREISYLTKLEELRFSRTQITGEGFANARYALVLRDLNLEGCPITNEGLEAISKLKNLRKLHAGGKCELVTDDGISNISQLNKLQTFSICGANMTHQGLQTVSKLPHLNTLWLENTPIDDQSIPILSRMRHLKNLWVRGTKISDYGMLRLINAMPYCDITY